MRQSPGDGALFWSPAKQRWIVRVVIDGKRVTRERKTKTEAQRIRREMRLGKVQRRVSRERLGAYLVRWLADQVALNRYSLNTRTTYASLIPVVDVAIGHLALDAVTPADIQRFIARAAAEYKPSSVRLMRAMLSAALSDAERLGLVAANPVRRTRSPAVQQTEREAPTADDVRALLERFTPPYHAMVTLAAHLGLRQSEVAGLRWQDVTETTITSAGQLARDGTWTPQRKAGEKLVFPLIEALSRALTRQRAHQAAQRLRAGSGWQDSGFVFANDDGTPVRQWQISAAFGRAVKGSGLPFKSFHDLRHAANSLLDELGVDEGTRMEMLGHASQRVNRRYTHTNRERVRIALERMAEAIGEG